MTSTSNGQQSGEQNVKKLNAWIVERVTNDDWRDYIRGHKLNRSEVAKECNFARSVFQQNPEVERILAGLETELRDDHILPSPPDASVGASVAPDARALGVMNRKVSELTERVQQLETEKATLRAKVDELQDGLRRHGLWERYIHETGRLLRP